MTPSSATPTKGQRLLDLLAFLSLRTFPVGVEAILRGVPGYALEAESADPKSIRRKFERDKAELRDAGIRIETVRTAASGAEGEDRYVLRARDFSLPVLRLLRSGERAGAQEFLVEPEELRAALEGLTRVVELPAFPFRRAARSALRKLTFDLADDEAAGGEIDEPHPIVHLDPHGSVAVEETMACLSDALLRRKEVRFDYYAIARDERDTRTVRPLGLVYQGSHWYLAGWDVEREDDRLYRIDRMEGLEVNPRKPRTPDYEIPRDHSLARLRGRLAWELGEEDDPGEEVLVRFRPPLHLLAERNGWGDPAEGDDGTRRFRVRRRGPFLRWILSHAGEATVEAPADCARELEALRLRTLEAHR